jgi:CubicO group peptidase (beta-lactamase class C family)
MRVSRLTIRLAALWVAAVFFGSGLAAPARVPGERWMAYASPEEAGFSSEKLAEAHEYWESIGSSAVFVVVDGAVLVDWGETARRFRCHSVRKSFMSGLYGIHVDNGNIDLEKTLEQLGIDDEPPLTAEEKTARIVDLLSARSGVYKLAAYEPPQNPKPPRGSHPPGTHWVYNNFDFNTLLTILEQETGVKFFEEFDVRFARPLQMQDYDPSHGYYHYERDKSIHPAYPFRMSARDMARFGLLYLNHGRWGSKRILSEEWVRQSTSAISVDTWTGGYGYMWWLHDAEPFDELGMFSALGVGGQSIDVIPGAGMVFVNRADTYLDGNVSDEERYELIRMILDARVGEAGKKPELVAAREPEPPYVAQTMTAAERARYTGAYPIPGSDETVQIREEGEGLVIEFGEGPIPFHNVGPDHFVVEDHLEHVYFEDGPAGEKLAVVADLLLMEGRLEADRGNTDRALELFEKTAEYFPDDVRVFGAMTQTHLARARQATERAIESYGRVTELRPDQTIDRSPIAWELTGLQGEIMPPELTEARLARFAGRYGPRLVELEDGQLWYSRDGRPRVRLIPLTDNVFAHAELDTFRVRFDSDEQGRISGITGMYRGGNRDHTPRDP